MLEGAPLFTGLTQVTSALLLAGVGVYALSLKPRTGASLAFGAFACAYAYGLVSNNVFIIAETPKPPAAVWMETLTYGTTVFATIALAIAFPRNLHKNERWVLLVGAFTFLTLVAFHWSELPSTRADLMPRPLTLALMLHLASWRALLVVLACRFFASRDGVERMVLGFASAGLLLDPASRLGASFFRSVSAGTPTEGIVGTPATFVVFVALIVIYLAATQGPASRVARNMALLGPAAILVAFLLEAFGWPGGSYSRFLMVAIFAYAILRHRLVDIDVKLEAKYLKPALASFLIGGVFVASETLQQIIGDGLGNAYVGIFAAGALVLAIAPLSRLADRWGAVAVSTTSAPDARRRQERAYRLAVLAALADGEMTPDEETHLTELADELGLTPGDALRIRRAAAQEVPRR